MSINPHEVQKTAHLARLTVSETEVSSLTNDLTNILQLVTKMNQTDVSSIEPLAHPLQAIQPLRPDIVTEIDQRDLFLQNAPQTYMGLFIVPQVIESE